MSTENVVYTNAKRAQSRSGRVRSVLIFLSLLTVATVALAAIEQNEAERFLETPVELRTYGRDSFHGYLTAVLPDRVEIVAPSGEIVQIALREIESIEVLTATLGRRAYYVDPASNRLMFTPTGFPMEKGQIHVANEEIAAFTGSYGVTDWASVWAGVSIPGGVVSARLSTSIGNSIGVSAGGMAGFSWAEVDGFVLLPYALASYGRPDHNITVGGGAAFLSDSIDTGHFVLVEMIGGKIPLNARTALVSENWFVQSKDSDLWIVPGAAIRILGHTFSWDLGAIVLWMVTDGEFVPMPWLSVTYALR